MSTDEQTIPSERVRARPQRRERIVAEAIALLDAEGINALSARCLGDDVSAGADSAGSHPTGHDELMELVVDEVFGEIVVPVADDPADWRTAAGQSARILRQVILRHPWIVSVFGEVGLAHLGPNLMRLSEDMLALFEAGGFCLEGADHAMNTLIAYVIGIATSEAAWLITLARSGRDEQDWMERLWPAAEDAVRAYPRLGERHAEQPCGRAHDDRQEKFEYGLDRILDGLALQRSC